MVVLACVTLGLVMIRRSGTVLDAGACSQSSPLSSSALRPPFVDAAGLRAQNDPRLDRLVQALDSFPAPFGPVAGGIGYDYDRYLSLGVVGSGLVTFTKREPRWEVLDPSSLRPRWGGDIPKAGMSWDTSSDAFFALRAGSRVSVSSYELGGGEQRWCRVLPESARNDQISTTTSGSDLLIALPTHGGTSLTRLSRQDGRVRWRVTAPGPGDDVGEIGGDLVVAGGRSVGDVYDPTGLAERTAPEVQLTARTLETGAKRWTWTAPAGTTTHLVGTVPDAGLSVLLVRSSAGSRLVTLDHDGRPVWHTPSTAAPLEATLRGSVVLLRGPIGAAGRDALAARDLATGRTLWQWPVRQTPQLFPYGFDLAGVPSLDEQHVLLPTTEALVSLDVHTGRRTSYPLPTDGINTTFWPYQVVVTDRLVAVVTNTGTVVVRREQSG